MWGGWGKGRRWLGGGGSWVVEEDSVCGSTYG